MDPAERATAAALADKAGFRTYRKTVPTLARAMPVAFTVETLEGTLSGHAGDYLCLDAKGNPYPCAKDIFLAGYTLDDGKDVLPASPS
jgi:hypothetical protein